VAITAAVVILFSILVSLLLLVGRRTAVYVRVNVELVVSNASKTAKVT